MATGDVIVVGPTTPDALDALMGSQAVVADSVTMCNMAGGQVLVMIIKA